jgi:predicted enzyme related to lactoylglutathione lyase
MSKESILGGSNIIAFIHITNWERARAFYEDVLGLRLVEEVKPFALVFDANGTMLRATLVADHKPAPGTVLGWQVESIEASVERLQSAGVVSLRYPGLNDKEPLGIWTSPSGARIAWFNDPDKNVLSLTQF